MFISKFILIIVLKSRNCMISLTKRGVKNGKRKLSFFRGETSIDTSSEYHNLGGQKKSLASAGDFFMCLICVMLKMSKIAKFNYSFKSLMLTF